MALAAAEGDVERARSAHRQSTKGLQRAAAEADQLRAQMDDLKGRLASREATQEKAKRENYWARVRDCVNDGFVESMRRPWSQHLPH